MKAELLGSLYELQYGLMPRMNSANWWTIKETFSKCVLCPKHIVPNWSHFTDGVFSMCFKVATNKWLSIYNKQPWQMVHYLTIILGLEMFDFLQCGLQSCDEQMAPALWLHRSCQPAGVSWSWQNSSDHSPHLTNHPRPSQPIWTDSFKSFGPNPLDLSICHPRFSSVFADQRL